MIEGCSLVGEQYFDPFADRIKFLDSFLELIGLILDRLQGPSFGKIIDDGFRVYFQSRVWIFTIMVNVFIDFGFGVALGLFCLYPHTDLFYLGEVFGPIETLHVFVCCLFIIFISKPIIGVYSFQQQSLSHQIIQQAEEFPISILYDNSTISHYPLINCLKTNHNLYKLSVLFAFFSHIGLRDACLSLYRTYNLNMLANFNKLLYFFARSVRRGPRGTPQSSSPSSSLAEKPEERSLDEQLEDEVEPLSYDRAVQESLKNKIAQELKYNYQGEDPSPHKLVHRPTKGAAWGLGGQLMLASKKVQLQGLKAQTSDIVQFLQLHQCKNIYVHDFFAENTERRENNRKRYAIVASCFSAKHCWKTGIELKNAFNLNSAKTKLRRRKQYDPIYAIMNGGKAEEWSLVSYKDFQINLMTEEQRQAMDLEWKWNNPVSDQVMDKHIEMKVMKKGRKRQFEDMD